MSNEKKPNSAERDSEYAKRRREFRDAKAARAAPDTGSRGRGQPPESIHLYGLHTVRAAMENPSRAIRKMLVTRNALARMEIEDPQSLPFPVEMVSPQDIDKLLPPDSIHQGVLIEAKPLRLRKVAELKDATVVLVLDQITDPHNVGAIMRSAVAFGASAIITTLRHSPQESGVLAKSASGAFEMIPYLQVGNLAEAIEELNHLGFTTIGLDSAGPERLENTLTGEKIALVLGAEGKGLRQKTANTVSALARLDMPGAIKSLNVSNAAAISLYAARKHLDS